MAFSLKEISAFDLPEQVRGWLTVGQAATCYAEPNEQVRKYPAFHSSRPLYGSVRVGAGRDQLRPGIVYHFALDESQGTGQGYDQLYLDTNRNHDLTDDVPLSPLKKVPAGAYVSLFFRTQVCFRFLTLSVDPNHEQEQLEVMPRFVVYDKLGASLALVTTKARKGTVRVGDGRFSVFLGHARGIPGGLDDPATALYLRPPDFPRHGVLPWWGGEELGTLYRRGDTYYRFATTPKADKLWVQPYEGPLGVFEAGTGGRRGLTPESVAGLLRWADGAVPIPWELGERRFAGFSSCRLPVGDYLPDPLDIDYGNLRIEIARNYHADGRRWGRWVEFRSIRSRFVRTSLTCSTSRTSPKSCSSLPPGSAASNSAKSYR